MFADMHPRRWHILVKPGWAGRAGEVRTARQNSTAARGSANASMNSPCASWHSYAEQRVRHRRTWSRYMVSASSVAVTLNACTCARNPGSAALTLACRRPMPPERLPRDWADCAYWISKLMQMRFTLTCAPVLAAVWVA